MRREPFVRLPHVSVEVAGLRVFIDRTKTLGCPMTKLELRVVGSSGAGDHAVVRGQ